jgi:hypothetical protein
MLTWRCVEPVEFCGQSASTLRHLRFTGSPVWRMDRLSISKCLYQLPRCDNHFLYDSLYIPYFPQAPCNKSYNWMVILLIIFSPCNLASDCLILFVRHRMCDSSHKFPYYSLFHFSSLLERPVAATWVIMPTAREVNAL